MKTLSKALIIIFLCIPSLQYGQMMLITTDKSVLKIDSLEEYDGYIKYKLENDNTTYYLPEDDIMILEPYSGKMDEHIISAIFKDQKSLALKLSLTGFRGESLLTSIEKRISQRMSIEASIKIQSSSFGDYYYEDVNGWGIEVGARWKLINPYSINKNMKVHHSMSGAYLKPGIGLSHRNEISYEGHLEYEIYYASMTLGYQIVISNTLVIDFFVGGAMYTGKGNSTPQHEMFSIPIKVSPNEGDLVGKNNFARAIGIKVGILFGT